MGDACGDAPDEAARRGSSRDASPEGRRIVDLATDPDVRVVGSATDSDVQIVGAATDADARIVDGASDSEAGNVESEANRKRAPIVDFATNGDASIVDLSTHRKASIVDSATNVDVSIVDSATNADAAIVDSATNGDVSIVDFATDVDAAIVDSATNGDTSIVDSSAHRKASIVDSAGVPANSIVDSATGSPTSIGNSATSPPTPVVDSATNRRTPVVDPARIDAAARRLAGGGLVAFPTETVYGLGADAADPIAVARIFAAKGRPSDHPLIVHVAPDADPLQWARELPPLAARLIDRFWPGPLTLILPRRAGVGAAAAGGQDAIGLRCPSHPVAQRLLRRYAALRAGSAAIGIAAPSANRFGRVSPTRAAHVIDEFDGASTTDVDADVFVLDGGDCDVGIESTIVDCSRWASVGPVLLRPGSVTAAMLAEVLGALPALPDSAAPRASGTLASHYAPATPLRLVDAAELDDAPDDVVAWAWSIDDAAMRPGWLRAPRHALAYAHDLYAVLRTLDARGARAIWIERPPSSDAWAGVRDRLARAAAAVS